MTINIKSIQLTEQHKAKLLEMCKALFPELKDLEIRDSMKDFCFPFEHICVEINRKTKLVIIHWFEFCMTHLVDKIYYPDNHGDRSTRRKVEYFFFQSFVDSIEGGTAGYDHPVDYLYNEFKKLKL